MEQENPLIALVKALARRRARLDAIPPQAANGNTPTEKQAGQK